MIIKTIKLYLFVYIINIYLHIYIYKIWTQIQGDHSCKLLPIRHYNNKIILLSDSLYKINHNHLISKIIHIQQINLILKIKDSNPENKIHINKVHIKFLLILNNKIIKDSNQLHLDNIDHHLLHLSKLKLWYNCLAIYQRDIVNILFIF